jgi:hypothetical protein
VPLRKPAKEVRAVTAPGTDCSHHPSLSGFPRQSRDKPNLRGFGANPTYAATPNAAPCVATTLA